MILELRGIDLQVVSKINAVPDAEARENRSVQHEDLVVRRHCYFFILHKVWVPFFPLSRRNWVGSLPWLTLGWVLVRCFFNAIYVRKLASFPHLVLLEILEIPPSKLRVEAQPEICTFMFPLGQSVPIPLIGKFIKYVFSIEPC